MLTRTSFSLVIALLLFNVSAFTQETVYIKASEFGRGILKERGGQCFVIAPFHVVAESMEDTITVIGDKFVESKAVYVKAFTSDLAVLRIIGGGEQYCAFWEVPEDFTNIVKDSYEGYIDLRNAYGSTNKLKIYVDEADDGVITIHPQKNGGNFAKGMSGSSLFTKYQGKKVYLGMLQQVAEGKGYVLQADNIDRILIEFFEPNKGHKKLTTEDEKNATNEKKKYLKGEFGRHLKFIENHFEELQNAKPSHLIIKFKSFLKRMDDVYSDYPEELNLPSQDKYHYLRLIGEIREQIIVCEKLIDKNPKSWDIEAIPQISMMQYKLEELQSLVSN